MERCRRFTAHPHSPQFTQTKTFLALCVLAALAVIWAASFLRIKQLTARERGRLEERLGERERIARELHDTTRTEKNLILDNDRFQRRV